jgi:hypothetical protein
MVLLSQICSPANIASAWRWLCLSRRNFPADADVWHLRFHREALLPKLLDEVASGRYRFPPMKSS